MHYRFLDEVLIRRLHDFLDSKDQRTSLRLDEFRTDSGFLTTLMTGSRPGYQERLRLLRTELGIARAIPGSRLEVLHRSDLGLAVLRLPWIAQAFDISQASQHAAATLVFEEGRLPRVGEAGAVVREELRAIHDLVEGPVVLSGTFEREVQLVVSSNGDTVTHPFMVRCIGDEVAYVEPECGLAIVFSASRHQDGVYVHEMGTRVTRSNAKPLDRISSKEFLRRLRPGATVNQVGRPRIPVEQWPNLARIGPAIDAVDLVRERLGLDTSGIFLADLKDKELGMTLSLLDLLLNGIGVEYFVQGFILGPAAAEAPQPENWLPAGFRLPIVANLRSKGVVVWVEGTGDIYLAENVICGFRPRQQSRWECDVRDTRFEKQMANPEVWVNAGWPGIPVFGEPAGELVPFQAPVGRHEFAGELWPLVSDGEDE